MKKFDAESNYSERKGMASIMFLSGLILVICSLLVVAFTTAELNKILSDLTYYIANGLTESDIETMAVIRLVATVVMVIGNCLMLFAHRYPRKKDAMLYAIEEHSNSVFCPNCKAEILLGNGRCPICGTQMEKRYIKKCRERR